MKNGSEPISSNTATINPHSAIDIGFAAPRRTEAESAVAAPTSRSSSIGNETTLSISAITANTNPTRLPMMISDQPARVVNRLLMNSEAESGIAPPAQFIKAERRNRPDQGKARCQRIEERQDRVTEDQLRQDDADHRIDDAQEDRVRRH